MSRRLPYFQFEPSEYLTKDISYCEMKLQGLFINICCYYWQRDCELTKTQLLKRLPYEDELNILIKEGIIDVKDDNIKIKFLLFQFSEIQSKSRVNSANGAKGGRGNKSETKANVKRNKSETKAIREEDIKGEDSLFAISDLYLRYLNDETLINAFCKGQKTNKETVLNKLKEFNEFLASIGTKIKKWNDYTTHFRNWFNKNKTIETQKKKINLGI
jgi:hypothetical protein